MKEEKNPYPSISRKRVYHLIPNLNTGGAEVLLSEMVNKMTDHNIDSLVICFNATDSNLEKKVNDAAEVISLGSNANSFYSTLRKLFLILSKEKPDALHCWMYHSNLIGGFIGRIAGIKQIIWSIHSNMPKALNIRTKIINILSALFSSILSDVIVFVSKSSRDKHYKIGYSKKKSVIINNGVEFNNFKFSENGRSIFRNELIADQDEILIGLLGRNVSEKDYPNFFQSLEFIKTDKKIRIVLAGQGMDVASSDINELISKYAKAIDVNLLGPLEETSYFFSGIDIFVISSSSESAPVSLLEAMSSGLRIVVTDVGDCKNMLNDDRFVSEPNNPKDLAEKISSSISLSNNSKQRIHSKFTERVQSKYSIDLMQDSYLALYIREGKQ